MKFKDYVFQHQRRRFRLRIYPYATAVKIFMDDLLRDVSVADGSKHVLDFFFRDDRNNQHRVHVERKTKGFKYHYLVYFDQQLIYQTSENNPAWLQNREVLLWPRKNLFY